MSRKAVDKSLLLGDRHLKDISVHFGHLGARVVVSNPDGQRVEPGTGVAWPFKVGHPRLTYSAQYRLAANRRGSQADYRSIFAKPK